MPKLVLLSEGYTGQSHDLKPGTTTVGRVEDNQWMIPDPSVSSHHAEVVLKGSEVLIRDLNSTNGTFINGDQITEAVLKPGQILQFGTVEARLETGDAAPAKKQSLDHTLVMPQGVRLGQGDTGNRPPAPGDTKTFQRKSNKGAKIFMTIAIIALIVIAGIVIFALSQLKTAP
jgi:pSer/pThr/pTyr-binding forkhead associated (FHA) protein